MTSDNYITLSKRINDFIKKSNYDKIFFTRFINKKDSLYCSKLNWHKLQSEDEIQLAIDAPKTSIIFNKFGYGLSNKQLDILKKLNVDTIHICGLQTDACVYAIAFQLFDIGIYPNILINYCETSKERNTFAKELIVHQFGNVDEKF